MANQVIKVGIIGVTPEKSWASLAHIPALQAMPDKFQITAIANSSLESAEKAARHFNVPHAFGSAEALSQSEHVDLVVVTVKVPHHFSLVKPAIEAGKHVYCEWPLGNGLAEARDMAGMAAKRDIVAICGTQARYSPAIAYARDLVADGYIGDILSTTVVGSGVEWGPTVGQSNAYLCDIANGASMLSIPMGHTLDAVCGVLGEVEDISASLENRQKTATVQETGETIPLTAHDQVLAMGKLASGIPISVHYRGGLTRASGLVWDIHGSKGDLVIEGPIGHAQLADLTLRGGNGPDLAMETLTIPERYQEGPGLHMLADNVGRLYADLYRDITEGTGLAPSFASAVTRQQMLAAMEASARSGTFEKPNDF
ncbi:MAG: Gfo/Idh/MocA family oxidoreductase [Pseudomonadota bacterium]